MGILKKLLELLQSISLDGLWKLCEKTLEFLKSAYLSGLANLCAIFGVLYPMFFRKNDKLTTQVLYHLGERLNNLENRIIDLEVAKKVDVLISENKELKEKLCYSYYITFPKYRKGEVYIYDFFDALGVKDMMGLMIGTRKDANYLRIFMSLFCYLSEEQKEVFYEKINANEQRIYVNNEKELEDFIKKDKNRSAVFYAMQSLPREKKLELVSI